MIIKKTLNDTLLINQKEQLSNDIARLQLDMQVNHKKWVYYYFSIVLCLILLGFAIDMSYVYRYGWSGFTYISLGIFFITSLLEKFNIHEKIIDYFNQKTFLAKMLRKKEKTILDIK